MGKYLCALTLGAIGLMAACSPSNGSAPPVSQKPAEAAVSEPVKATVLKPQTIEEWTEEMMRVPKSVRMFRERLSASPNAHDYALVELAPQMKKYVLTVKDGSNVRVFAQAHLHLNRQQVQEKLYLPESGEYRNYNTAFIFTPSDFEYQRMRQLFQEKDKNKDLVLSMEEQ